MFFLSINHRLSESIHELLFVYIFIIHFWTKKNTRNTFSMQSNPKYTPGWILFVVNSQQTNEPNETRTAALSIDSMRK